MSQTEVTEALAIWGAVTGTIGTLAGLLGLWLRFRQHGLDKAKLECESSFGFELPTHAKHKIIIRSVGHRPVTIDHVRYYVMPRTLKQKLTKSWQHKQGRWIWDQKPRSATKLEEGEKTELSISLPDGLVINEIYRADIIDQSGRFWEIKWPSLSRLSKIATKEEISKLEKENEKRLVSVTGFRLSEKYYIETKFNTKPGRTGTPSGRSFWFVDSKSFEKKLRDIEEKQIPEFLAGNCEEIV